MVNPDNSAFPDDCGSNGLTKRQYLAGLAMQGLLAAHTGANPPDASTLAKLAVGYADGLITQLALPQK